MISLKEIIWVREKVDVVESIYYDGMLNGHLVVSIYLIEDDVYTIYDHMIYTRGKTFQAAASDRVEYVTLNDAKEAAKKKVEDFVFGLIDMRDYKINELLK
jgi:hypothetical protein